MGRAYEYMLETHCGITHAYIDGSYWPADPPLVRSGGNPPEGWKNPQVTGTLVLLSKDRAQFDADGRTAYFKRGDEKPVPCLE